MNKCGNIVCEMCASVALIVYNLVSTSTSVCMQNTVLMLQFSNIAILFQKKWYTVDYKLILKMRGQFYVEFNMVEVKKNVGNNLNGESFFASSFSPCCVSLVVFL